MEQLTAMAQARVLRPGTGIKSAEGEAAGVRLLGKRPRPGAAAKTAAGPPPQIPQQQIFPITVLSCIFHQMTCPIACLLPVRDSLDFPFLSLPLPEPSRVLQFITHILSPEYKTQNDIVAMLLFIRLPGLLDLMSVGDIRPPPLFKACF